MQKALNLTLPDWCTEEILKEMEDCVSLEYEIRSYTEKLKRLLGGRVIQRFVENMKTKNNNLSRKIYLYSGHEVNLASFMRAHDIHEPRIPTFGSAILFEMLRDDLGNRFVKVIIICTCNCFNTIKYFLVFVWVQMFFWNGSTREIIPLKLGQYEEECPMDEYLKMVKNVIPSAEETQDFWKGVKAEELWKMFSERFFYN